jgi:hypothetical protein
MRRPFVHAKAIVADGRRLFVGSENLSSASLDRNREIGILMNDSGLAGQVERTFASDWRGEKALPSATAPPSTGPVTGGSLQVTVTANPSTIRRGNLLTITGHARPDAACTIEVIYPDGYVSHARSLSGTRVAGSDGGVTWSWHVGSTVTGTAHAVVRCSLGATSGSGEASFVIE